MKTNAPFKSQTKTGILTPPCSVWKAKPVIKFKVIHLRHLKTLIFTNNGSCQVKFDTTFTLRSISRHGNVRRVDNCFLPKGVNMLFRFLNVIIIVFVSIFIGPFVHKRTSHPPNALACQRHRSLQFLRRSNFTVKRLITSLTLGLTDCDRTKTRDTTSASVFGFPELLCTVRQVDACVVDRTCPTLDRRAAAQSVRQRAIASSSGPHSDIE